MYRQLGIMRLDDEGLWVDEPLGQALREFAKRTEKLPPQIPAGWLAAVGVNAEDAAAPPGAEPDENRTKITDEREAKHGSGNPN